MTSKLKCPFCGKQMKIGMLDPDDSMGTVWMSIMPCDCVCSYGASKAVWQALIQSQQDLEESQQATIQNAQTVLEIHKDLEIATKALEDIVSDYEVDASNGWLAANAKQALEQIKHKEK